jgi:hypothetical protein
MSRGARFAGGGARRATRPMGIPIERFTQRRKGHQRAKKIKKNAAKTR